VLFAGDEEGRSSVSSAARGLEWLVFGLVIALFLVLLVMGWAYLLASADRHATDMKLTSGAITGSLRSMFGAFRLSRDPAEPRPHVKWTLHAVASAVRAALSPRSSTRGVAGSSGPPPGAPAASRGDVDLEDVTLDRPPQSVELKVTGPGSRPLTVPLSAASARASDSPTGQMHDQLSYAAVKATRAGFLQTRTRGTGAGVGAPRSGASLGTGGPANHRPRTAALHVMVQDGERAQSAAGANGSPRTEFPAVTSRDSVDSPR
jgi:hypothetical protein